MTLPPEPESDVDPEVDAAAVMFPNAAAPKRVLLSPFAAGFM
jgi:hypothetical protein